MIFARGEGPDQAFAANFEGTRELISFLIEDCCGDHEQLCALLDIAKSFRLPPPRAS
ncbi:hypothetical protein [Sphingomonas panacisoli]|uniref:hypothetical protein n=1 Tax=Sphingomonas panacisoli TaxID=1813879 RepID=UPI001EFFF83E|nr:hypothetical protein [Sphingomonas panacisoli]